MLANAATMRILIKGGKVVNDDCTLEADVYIENGIIQQVGRELMIPGGAKVIDATGKLVIPGGIDTSTHFHQTFMNATCVDDFYHGTKVAARAPPRPPRGYLNPPCFAADYPAVKAGSPQTLRALPGQGSGCPREGVFAACAPKSAAGRRARCPQGRVAPAPAQSGLCAAPAVPGAGCIPRGCRAVHAPLGSMRLRSGSGPGGPQRSFGD
uniref:Uncharacterized protein n=1 Tax=Nothoprocta perdicaria TaxID=30464 RepID=A0A8C6Z7Z8_NOTPE